MNGLMNMGFNSISYTGAANYQISSTGGFIGTVLPIVNEFAEKGKYEIEDVANWFLNKSPMTHLKLQKLCYYAQAWTYALKNFRLINSDFQAWVHGPVSPILYEKFKSFGFDTIKLVGNFESKISSEDEEILESVWLTYGDYSGNALEIQTHRELPWIEARTGYRPDERCQIAISPETMKKFYRSIARR